MRRRDQSAERQCAPQDWEPLSPALCNCWCRVGPTLLEAAAPAPASAPVEEPKQQGRPGTSAAAEAATAQLLRERDKTIQELMGALEASRRRAAVLEQALEEAKARAPGLPQSPGRPKARPAAGGPGASSRELVLRSRMHQEQYRKVKEDYQRRDARLARPHGPCCRAEPAVRLAGCWPGGPSRSAGAARLPWRPSGS